MNHLLSFAILFAVFVLGTLIRPLLDSYGKKKGETLATSEDIDEIVKQMKAMTQATEQIKTEMPSAVWDRQRHWEMKREVVFEAAKRMSEMDDSLLSLPVALKEDRRKKKIWETQPPAPGEEALWSEPKAERQSRWNEASSAMEESRVLMAMVCPGKGYETFNDLGAFVNKVAAILTQDVAAYDSCRPELFKKILCARDAMRTELGVVTPQSNGSSAALVAAPPTHSAES